jgi:CheY-like chemotaxis protein
VLHEVPKEGAIHANVSEIRRAGERAADLTRQLLAFGRRQMLAPVALDLNAAVLGMEKMLRRLIGADVEFEVRLAPRLGSVRVDPGQVEQVVVNLVVNARDAMPEGGRLVVETADEELDEDDSKEHAVAPGSYVRLSVTDTGIGMDASTRAHIFEPFFTTKERGRGTGLGLPTVYGIVKQSGGTIRVFSEAGRGTSFDVYLPRVDEPARTGAHDAGAPRDLSGTETVLLVENEASVRTFARQALERAGYRVLEAENGSEALAVLERHPAVALVVTDVVMPVMGGRDLGRRLSTALPALPVLYISGFTDGTLFPDGAPEPSTAFLGKPFSRDLLLRSVRELLDRGAQPGEPAGR